MYFDFVFDIFSSLISLPIIIPVVALSALYGIVFLCISLYRSVISIHALRGEDDSKNIQICNIVFVHSAYKIIYFCDSCAFYLT